MITLEHVHKNYETRMGKFTALNDINLTVKKGDIFGIIGKSGAGKSTLIRCINLLELPSSGKVFVADKDLLQLSASQLRKARRKIGMIFQHFNLLSCRTVYDNIGLPLELAGFSKSDISKKIMPLLDLTGLLDKKEAYPHQLSGGQKQRVAIARALSTDPHVLLSDEATSALDPETTAAILRLLKNIRDALNVTILLITHEMSVIKACCDTVGILHNSHLIEINEVGKFFAHPKSEIAKNFIASTLLQHLPETIERNLISTASPDHSPVLRLWFLQGAATQPIISHLSHKFNLEINILQANIEYIKNHIIGMMIVGIRKPATSLPLAIEYLTEIGVNVEVIGFVPNTIVPFN